MPHFDNAPPTDLGPSGYRLIRTPAAHAILGHVVSERLTGCRTHFTGNRTIPCESPNCDACNSGITWRWHGYVLLLIDATQELVIFESTARAAAAFTDYYQRYGTTRGAHMKAERLNARSNGRVLIQLKPADLAKINLPKPIPIEKLLCHIWNIPETQVDTPAAMTRPPHQNIRVDRSKPELRPAFADDDVIANEITAHLHIDPQGNGKPDRPPSTRRTPR